jgi:two-component system chemotaxis response regulator CheY
MRSLVVEDEFVARCILQRFLARYGDCDLAVDGDEAIAAARAALDHGPAYDLICLDIGIPKLDGQGVLEHIRALEVDRGIEVGRGCKVIMTTAASSKAHVMGAFRGGADAYLTKPITLNVLADELRALRLIG